MDMLRWCGTTWGMVCMDMRNQIECNHELLSRFEREVGRFCGWCGIDSPSDVLLVPGPKYSAQTRLFKPLSLGELRRRRRSIAASTGPRIPTMIAMVPRTRDMMSLFERVPLFAWAWGGLEGFGDCAGKGVDTRWWLIRFQKKRRGREVVLVRFSKSMDGEFEGVTGEVRKET